MSDGFDILHSVPKNVRINEQGEVTSQQLDCIEKMLRQLLDLAQVQAKEKLALTQGPSREAQQ